LLNYGGWDSGTGSIDLESGIGQTYQSYVKVKVKAELPAPPLSPALSGEVEE